MIKEGATIIDVGINRIKDEETGKTKLVGDVDFDSKFLILPLHCTALVFVLKTTTNLMIPCILYTVLNDIVLHSII